MDVAVDLRKDSATFGQHVAVELSAENRWQLWIPVGFAHGFLALEDGATLQYQCTDTYHPESERASPGMTRIWASTGGWRPVVSERDRCRLRDVREPILNLFTTARAPLAT